MKRPILFLFALSIAFYSSALFSQSTFVGDNSGATIDDDFDVESQVNVNSLSGYINTDHVIDNVKIDLDHSDNSDLLITLVAPDGTSFDLASNQSGSDYDNTIFQDGGADIEQATAPYSGVYEPVDGTFAFNMDDVQVNGIWKLKISDISSFCCDGTFNSFEITFAPGPGCVPPTNLTASNTYQNKLDVSADLSATKHSDYEWIVIHPGDAPSVANAISSGNVPGVLLNDGFSIFDLNGNTTYEVHIRSICGNGQISGWSDPVTFSTDCLNETLPYQEDFSAFFPNCWYSAAGSAGLDPANNDPNGYEYEANSSTWFSGNYLNQSDPAPKAAMTNLLNNGVSSWLLSPGFDLSSGGYEIAMEVALTSSAGSFQSSLDADDKIVLLYTTDGGATWNNLMVWDQDNEPSHTGGQHIMDISSISATNVQFAFYVTSGFQNDNGDDSKFYIRDLSIRTSEACPQPSNIELSDFTTSSLTFSWNSTPSSFTGNYQYVLMDDGVAPDSGNAVKTGTTAVGSSTLTLNGLSNTTQYDLYLRNTCMFSEWSAKVDGKTRIANDVPCNAKELTLGTTSSGTAYTNNGATSDPNEPEMNLNTGAAKSVWFKFSAPQYGNVTLSTDIAGATLTDTEIAVYEVGDCSDYNTYEQIGFDQDGGSTISFNSVLDVYRLNAGTEYYVQVDVWNNSEGDFGMSYLDLTHSYDGSTWSPSDPIGVSDTRAAIVIDEGSVNINSNTNAALIDVYPSASLKIDALVGLSKGIRFLSDQNGSGQFEEYTQNTTREAIVQRYVPVATNNSRGYRFLTTAVETDQSIYDNWQESGESPDGFGTHITGSSSGANGFDQTQTGNPSMYTFDNSFTGDQSNAWNSIPNTETRKLYPGKPYRIFIRGDRNYDLDAYPANPPNADVTLRAKGELRIGSATNDSLSTKQDYYSLVGNPYQAIVNMNDVSTTNLNTNYYWIWDPNLSSKGDYVTVELPAGTTPSSSDVSQFVQPGQAFFVQTLNDGSASITFDQADKAVNELPTDVFSDDENYQMDIKLYQQDQFADGQPEADALRISFSADNDNAITQNDAQKLGNPDENLARLQNGKYISIEKRQLPEDEETLGLFTSGYATDDYLFKIDLAQLPGNMTAYLVDEHEDEQIQLNNGVNEIGFSVDQNIPESVATNRFSLKFKAGTLGNDEVAENKINVHPNPVPGESVDISSQGVFKDEVDVKLSDISGRILHQGTKDAENGNFSLKVGQYQAGVYILSLSNENRTYQKRLIIK